MSKPRVTVLMPMHNNAATVREAAASVLAQTFPDFELLVIDDASSDSGAEMLRALGDTRVRVVRNETRLEIAASLNRGLTMARGEFIARMDADDLCLPERLAQQVAFLEEHPGIGVVGSHVRAFSEEGDGAVREYPAEPGRVAAALLFRCTLAHPSVMMRRGEIARRELRYDPAFRRAQDYDLWFRCVQAGVKLANVGQVLLRYRVHAEQATQRNLDISTKAAAAVRERIIRWLGMEPRSDELTLHQALSVDQLSSDAPFGEAAVRWLETLAAANERSARFEREAFLRVLTGRYATLRRIGGPMSSCFEPYVQPR